MQPPLYQYQSDVYHPAIIQSMCKSSRLKPGTIHGFQVWPSAAEWSGEAPRGRGRRQSPGRRVAARLCVSDDLWLCPGSCFGHLEELDGWWEGIDSGVLVGCTEKRLCKMRWQEKLRPCQHEVHRAVRRRKQLATTSNIYSVKNCNWSSRTTGGRLQERYCSSM